LLQFVSFKRDNPFNTNNYAWIDAGYAQGEAAYFPGDFQWYPIFPDNKISLIKVIGGVNATKYYALQLTPSYDKLSRYTTKVLYRRDEAVISGGFLGGSRKAVARFYSAFHWKVVGKFYNKNRLIYYKPPKNITSYKPLKQACKHCENFALIYFLCILFF
jgi:hypothetical protein